MKKYFFSILMIVSLINPSCDKGEKKDVENEWGPDIFLPDAGFKVVGYLPSWRFYMIDNLEIGKLTHMNIAFFSPDYDGDLSCEGNLSISEIVRKGHEANLKVYISLAGGGQQDVDVWKRLMLSENRLSFIRKIVKYVEDNDLDGVDVDIEWNLLPYLNGIYSPFIVTLKEALHAAGKGISAALGPVSTYNAVDLQAIHSFDFINVMVYDLTGFWDTDNIGPHSPFWLAEDAIHFWTIEKGVPSERIVLGVPFYGYDFTAPAHSITYREMVSMDTLNAYQDETGLTFYNGLLTIVRKTELAKNSVGGIMIWEISQDATGDLSLLRAISQTVNSGNCPVTTFFRDADSDGAGDPAHPLESCSEPPGYVTNRDDQDDSNHLTSTSF